MLIKIPPLWIGCPVDCFAHLVYYDLSEGLKVYHYWLMSCKVLISIHKFIPLSKFSPTRSAWGLSGPQQTGRSRGTSNLLPFAYSLFVTTALPMMLMWYSPSSRKTATTSEFQNWNVISPSWELWGANPIDPSWVAKSRDCNGMDVSDSLAESNTGYKWLGPNLNMEICSHSLMLLDSFSPRASRTPFDVSTKSKSLSHTPFLYQRCVFNSVKSLIKPSFFFHSFSMSVGNLDRATFHLGVALGTRTISS